MMKTCKTVLRCARKHFRAGTPSFYELAQKTDLHPQDTIQACKLLVTDGYMEFTYSTEEDPKYRVPVGVILTLKGRKPIEHFTSELKEYIKDNWIAIIALIISLVALLQSLGIIQLPSPIPKKNPYQ